MTLDAQDVHREPVPGSHSTASAVGRVPTADDLDFFDFVAPCTLHVPDSRRLRTRMLFFGEEIDGLVMMAFEARR